MKWKYLPALVCAAALLLFPTMVCLAAPQLSIGAQKSLLSVNSASSTPANTTEPASPSATPDVKASTANASSTVESPLPMNVVLPVGLFFLLLIIAIGVLEVVLCIRTKMILAILDKIDKQANQDLARVDQPQTRLDRVVTGVDRLPERRQEFPAQQTARQPYTPTQQPYMPAQQPYMPAQQPYMPAQQPYIPAQQPYMPAQQPYMQAQQPYTPTQQSYTPAQQSYTPASSPQKPNELEEFIQRINAGNEEAWRTESRSKWEDSLSGYSWDYVYISKSDGFPYVLEKGDRRSRFAVVNIYNDTRRLALVPSFSCPATNNEEVKKLFDVRELGPSGKPYTIMRPAFVHLVPGAQDQYLTNEDGKGIIESK